jgi:hypothetical protein
VIVVADAQGWAAEWVGPLTAVLLAGALLSAVGARRLPRGGAWVGLVFFVSAAGATASIRLRNSIQPPTQHVAWLCASLCLLWSAVAAAATAMARQRRDADRPAAPRLSFISLGRLAAVLFGVVAAIIQSVVLVMRMIYVGVDLVHGYPWEGAHDYGFGPPGEWSLALLFLSCGVGLLSTGERRLATVQLWTAVLLTLWACLLVPPFRIHPSGAFERTGGTLLLLASLSMVLTGAIVIDGGFEHRRRRRLIRTDPDALTMPRSDAPGFRTSCGVLAMVIIVLTCYHLLVPLRATWGGFRGSTLIASLASAVAAGGAFLLLGRSWSGNLADASLGLASFGFCGLAMLAVPGQAISLADRYPMMFNAMIVGLTFTTGLWTWLACVWDQQLDHGEAWTTAGRLIPHAKRFAFLSAALALVAGALMTYWPRLPAIASMDHSIGRITAGFSAHLFLVLVMLWCSRRLRRLTFHLLTVLAVLSTAGFIIIRMVPFASRLG